MAWKVSLEDAFDLLEVCEAMGFAHPKVLFTEIKPENIMIGSFGEVLVVDWGLVKIIGKIQNFGMKKTYRQVSKYQISERCQQNKSRTGCGYSYLYGSGTSYGAGK